jgi:hypothetical protein
MPRHNIHSLLPIDYVNPEVVQHYICTKMFHGAASSPEIQGRLCSVLCKYHHLVIRSSFLGGDLSRLFLRVKQTKNYIEWSSRYRVMRQTSPGERNSVSFAAVAESQ